jgi:uncharacterized circularly permuted ATP-grasp superfamily protein/uncharacterized alpha-E superfamily protein
LDGAPKPAYARLIAYLKARKPSELQALDERMEATLREMGVTFGRGDQPWICDLLPHIFEAEEWQTISKGVKQRVRAFDRFLHDVYGARRILRDGVVPIYPVLGSPHYQNALIGLPRCGDHFLHLSGTCLTRDQRGTLMVKHHYFSRASGLAYMMQNRRALARVLPELFEETAVRSFADAPLAIMESLRGAAPTKAADASVVLLSPGVESPVYSAHSFLARRMGIPLVQGGDLVVLHDCVYLKTVEGLKKVDVIYNRVLDAWLDSLVLRRDSRHGVPGLVHCLRKGTVALVNGIGSDLADDRSLLCFSSQIIRYYLNEDPILPTVSTFWLGDIDQREMVLDQPEAYCIRRIFGNDLAGSDTSDVAAVRKHASHFIAQPREQGAISARGPNMKEMVLNQDHIVYSLRSGDRFEIFPGALTRIFLQQECGASWISKDTWVLGENPEPPSRVRRLHAETHATRQVTSRVADSFYWLGRYLERASHQAYLIQVIETLETEELNSAERKLYRPMWNRLLPPLEKSAGESRRSITNRLDRYRLVLLPEPGTVASMLRRAVINAGSLQECLSPEAWATLSDLRSRFQRTRYKEKITDQECARTARRLSDTATRLIPQFFAIAANTMLADDGWRFCETGQMLERAVITANSVVSISKTFAEASEIELSAFLRLLGTRDAYRRVYQMRAEPVAVLEFLWQNAQAPRSVTRCLHRCATLLRESAAADTPGTRHSLGAIDELTSKIEQVNWAPLVAAPAAAVAAPFENANGTLISAVLNDLINATMNIHNAISDGFLSHQTSITQGVQGELAGV